MSATRSLLYILAVVAMSNLATAPSSVVMTRSSPRGIANDLNPLQVFHWFQQAIDIIVSYFLPPEKKYGGGSSTKGSRSEARTKKQSYLGYQVVRVRPMNEDALNEIESLEDEPGLQFFNKPARNKSADILVPPDMASKLRRDLARNSIEFTVLSHNIEVDMRKQNAKMSKEQVIDLKESQGHPFTFTRYHRYSDMEDYMDYLVSYAPQIVDVLKIGLSSEGRSLKVVRLSSGKSKDRPAIWIDAGMHGREWVTPSVAMFILKQLVEKYQNYRNLVDNVDWYIMPVANPDGYEFSHMSDRFWRKNRGNNKEKPDEEDDEYKEEYKNDDDDDDDDEDDDDDDEDDEDYKDKEDEEDLDDEDDDDYKDKDDYRDDDDSLEDVGEGRIKPKRKHRQKRIFWGTVSGRCKGVDLNRNFGFHWGEGGSSDDPCDPNYAGPKAFSEPETKAISDFIMERKDRIKAYLTLHAYSQMWLVPWGHTNSKPKDYDDLLYMARRAVEALERVHGTRYRIGPTAKLMYPTSGSSEDWAKGKAGIKYSYSIELRDQGTFGFLLPASQILPTGKETFAAIRVIAKAIASDFS